MHISMCSTVGRREATSERERAGRSGLFMAEFSWPELQRGQWTVARMMDGSVHRGVLYTVDPESGHMVLLKPVPSEDGKMQPNIVTPFVLFAASLDYVAQDSDDGTRNAHELFSNAKLVHIGNGDADAGEISFDDSTIETRRQALMALLSSQRAPFVEQPGGELLILGCLRIIPPYTPSSCICENEIVLDRVLEIIAQHPLPTSNVTT